MNKLLITTALIAATVATGVAKASAADNPAMTPDFARKAGEINAVVGRCGYVLRDTAQFWASLPAVYLNENRKDLLAQSWTAATAFNDRYKINPIASCNQARSDHAGYFQAR